MAQRGNFWGDWEVLVDCGSPVFKFKWGTETLEGSRDLGMFRRI